MAKQTVNHRTVAISSGNTESDEIDLLGQTICGISFPSALTSTAMTFSVSNGGGTFNAMADGAGTDVSKTIAASKYIVLNPSDFAGVDKLKLVAGSAEGADRSIIVHLREIE